MSSPVRTLVRGAVVGAALFLQAASFGAPILLVGEKTGAALAICDPDTLRVVAQVKIPANPHEVTTDGTHAYVSHPSIPAITVVDIAGRRMLDPIELGGLGPAHGIWFADGKIFFANENNRTVGRIDPASRRIEWVFGTGEQSHMMMVSPDGTRIFLPTRTGNLRLLELRVNPNPPPPRKAIPIATSSIQAANLNRPKAPPAPAAAQPRPEWIATDVPAGAGVEGIDLSPDGRELWGINVQDRSITVVDTVTRTVKATIGLDRDFSNRIRFTPDGRYVFVSELNGTDVLVLDAATHREVKRIDVGGGNEGISMHPDGTRAFVAIALKDKVTVVDLKTLTVSGEISGMSTPDGMAWVR